MWLHCSKQQKRYNYPSLLTPAIRSYITPTIKIVEIEPL